MRERLAIKYVRTIVVGCSQTALGLVKLVLGPKERVVRFRILRPTSSEDVQFTRREVRFQSLGNFLCNLIFNPEDVLKLTVIASRPKLPTSACVDQLHIRADFVARVLHCSFEDRCNAKLVRHRR